MLSVAGQHPLLGDTTNASLGAAHIAAEGCGGTHLVDFSRSIGARSRAASWPHPFLPTGKIVVVIVVMVVVSFGRTVRIGIADFGLMVHERIRVLHRPARW